MVKSYKLLNTLKNIKQNKLSTAKLTINIIKSVILAIFKKILIIPQKV